MKRNDKSKNLLFSSNPYRLLHQHCKREEASNPYRDSTVQVCIWQKWRLIFMNETYLKKEVIENAYLVINLMMSLPCVLLEERVHTHTHRYKVSKCQPGFYNIMQNLLTFYLVDFIIIVSTSEIRIYWKLVREEEIFIMEIIKKGKARFFLPVKQKKTKWKFL